MVRPARKNTRIINLYGGPGCGKSTTAAYLFYLLKTKGFNAELVTEYAKSWAWENRNISIYDQFYFLGKQSRKESMLYGKVDYIVTDCPVMMEVHYARVYCNEKVAKGIEEAVKAFYHQSQLDGHEHIHVNLIRNKPYNEKGRYQSEAEAVTMDGQIKTMLKSMGVDALPASTSEEELKFLLEAIILGE